MLRIFLVLFLFAVFTNCSNTDKTAIKNERLELVPEPDQALREEYEKNQHAIKHDCYFSEPDTSVFGIKIRNAESALNILGKQTKLSGDSTHTFYSADKKQRLALTVHAGDAFNEVSIFTVSYSDQSKENFTQLDTKEFETEKGIKLGLSKRKLLEKLGDCYTAKDSSEHTIQLYYILESPHDSKTKLLNNNNMPSYYASYKLTNDKLNRMEFGFQYP